MNSEAWLASDNAEELLCFAAPRIPREHLALVLAEIAEATVYYWSVRYPHDWRLTLAVATLRAWCFGHATNEELACARDLVVEAQDVPPSQGHADRAALAAVTCVGCCATVPLQHAAASSAQAEDLECMDMKDLIGGAVHFAALAAQHGFDGEPSAFQASRAQFAQLVRRLIIYPTAPNEEWVATPGLVFAGDLMLRIDGRKIGDVVRRDDFTRLSPERAIAFDAAQQHPEAETPLPSGYRERLAAERAAPKPRPSGCVMSPIMVDGRQVGTRISCFGHHEEPEPVHAPAPAPITIEQDDPHGVTLARRLVEPQGSPAEQETRARQFATATYVARGRVPVDGEKLKELMLADRKRRAVLVPDTESAPGSRWVTAMIFAALSFAVFARVAWGGSSGDDTTSFVFVALAVAAAVWMAIEGAAGAEKDVVTPALSTLAVVGFVGWLVVFLMESGVRFVLDKAHLDTPGSIRRREDSLQRDRRELATRRTEEVRARLGRKQQKLAALRPVPLSVEAMLAVLAVSPLLLGFAFALSWRVSHTVAWHAVVSRTPSQVPLWVAGFPKRPGVT